MKEIGELLKATREESGVTLEEASNDLEIKALILENIEDGNIGCFKDIFVLKEYIYNYAKYLGLEPEKIIDEFNEYLFDYTSKISLSDIKKAQSELKETKNNHKASPPKRKSDYQLTIATIIILLKFNLLAGIIYIIFTFFFQFFT